MLGLARRLGAEAAPSHLAAGRWVRRESVRRADAVIVVKGRFVPENVVERLRRGGAAVINYFPDNPLYPDFYETALIKSLRAYDLVCVWSEPLAQKLRALSIRARMLPFGYDPGLYSTGDPAIECRWDVSFVGQWSEIREQHVKALDGVRVAVAGSGWERAGQLPVGCSVLEGTWFGRRAADVYRQSRVGLNILHPQNAGAHNMRTWELPATGTAAVMTDSAFHRDLFGADGARLFNGADELRTHVIELLSDDALRGKVAATGRGAVKDGTYRRRMRRLVEWIRELRGDSTVS
jgi:hypothetical protein